MLPEIRQFPSDEFYEGKLQDGEFLKHRKFRKGLEFMENANLKFFDVSYGKEQCNRYSFYNQSEITACYKIVEALEDKLGR